MKPTSIIGSALTGLAKILFVLAGLSFLVGGGLIYAETQMNRFSAELVGVAIAAACVLLGLLTGALSRNLNSKEESLSINAPN